MFSSTKHSSLLFKIVECPEKVLITLEILIIKKGFLDKQGRNREQVSYPVTTTTKSMMFHMFLR
jgi:hypothetical protein